MGLGGIFGKIGKVLGQAAPIVGGLLGGPAAGAITSILSQTLGVKDEPDAVLHALENDPEAIERIKTLEIQQKTDLTRLQITAETARIVSDNTADTERLAEVNKTMRVEASSADPVVRRARSSFIYCMSFSWTIQMTAFAIAIIYDPDGLAKIGGIMVPLAGMWSIALGVIGVAVRERSKDKAVAAGLAPKEGLLSSIIGKAR